MMSKQVTFGHILTILVMIIIPILIWSKNVEVRFSQVVQNTKTMNENSLQIKDLEQSDNDFKDLIHSNQIEVMNEFSDLKVLIIKNSKP